MRPRVLALYLSVLALPAFAVEEAKLLEEARSVAQSVPPKLLNVIQSEIKKGGPEQAIGTCRDLAPKIAAAAGEETGWAIRRVSMKNRNPKAVPDDWEKGVLAEFEQRIAAGDPPINIEKGMIVAEGDQKFYRYMRPLMTQKLCMECHGPEAGISPNVKARLQELYPQDRATGFTEGMMRGALTIKKPL